MTKHKTDPEAPAVQNAKGAAQSVIGKLIGDDAEVRKGRDEQAAADRAAAADDDHPTSQEKTK